MIHIMLDLKTWGTAPGADIRSIGAVVFDPTQNDFVRDEHGITKAFYIACDNPNIDPVKWRSENGSFPEWDKRCAVAGGAANAARKYPLKRDPATAQRWSEQSADAQAAFADPVDLREALVRFGEWLQRTSPEVRIYNSTVWQPGTDIRLWSHGPAFDPPILAAAYEAVGLLVPWHYRGLRDTRTIFDLAGIDDHTAWMAQTPGPLGIPHHALDDAICQARAVCGAYERIREPIRIAEQFGDKVCDVFDQMKLGNWRDDHGHPVHTNKAMVELLGALEEGVNWRDKHQ